jgi:hypothetical protein
MKSFSEIRGGVAGVKILVVAPGTIRMSDGGRHSFF